LGVMLFRGEGVSKDRTAAAQFYRAAAETGYAPALYNYAACLMAGHGVPQDQQLALQYWRAAYEQNYPPAMDGPPPAK
jgi:TPR repeat protein